MLFTKGKGVSDRFNPAQSLLTITYFYNICKLSRLLGVLQVMNVDGRCGVCTWHYK